MQDREDALRALLEQLKLELPEDYRHFLVDMSGGNLREDPKERGKWWQLATLGSPGGSARSEGTAIGAPFNGRPYCFMLRGREDDFRTRYDLSSSIAIASIDDDVLFLDSGTGFTVHTLDVSCGRVRKAAPSFGAWIAKARLPLGPGTTPVDAPQELTGTWRPWASPDTDERVVRALPSWNLAADGTVAAYFPVFKSHKHGEWSLTRGKRNATLLTLTFPDDRYTYVLIVVDRVRLAVRGPDTSNSLVEYRRMSPEDASSVFSCE